MSSYLNTEEFSGYLDRYHGDESQRQARRVGIDRQHESWYFDIMRFFGERAIDPSAVRIRTSAGSASPPDPLIDEFSRRIAGELRAQGRIYDGPQVVQVIAADWHAAPPVISIEPVNYVAQAASFALDLVDASFESWGGTLRDYLRVNYSSTDLRDSPLLTCAGVCGFLLVKEADQAYLLRVTRSGNLASLENSVGPSAAGSVEFADDYRDLGDMIVRAMGQEVEEELGLKREEYDIKPLAYAREMLRGDRPQFFTLVATALSRSEVVDRINSLTPDAREFTDCSFMRLTEGRLAGRETQELNFEARMCAWLIEEWSVSI
jgi:hypothetical protein